MHQQWSSSQANKTPSSTALRYLPDSLQASENALRQQATETHLRERSARVSLLSIAVAHAHRRGRDRLLTAQALKALGDAARARRLASSAAARTKALRLSRALRVWNDRARRNRRPPQPRGVVVAGTSVPAAAGSGGVLALRLSRCLRSWRERSRSARRRRGALVSGTEALSLRRRRAALGWWREACCRREAAAVKAARDVARLRLSRLRRGMRGWRRAAFGDRGWTGLLESDRDPAGGGGSRVLARLEGVAESADATRWRRRARAALRLWVGRARAARRRVEVERQADGGRTLVLVYFFAFGVWHGGWKKGACPRSLERVKAVCRLRVLASCDA